MGKDKRIEPDAIHLFFLVFRNFTFNDVHVEGSRLIAEAAAEAGVSRFVQVSALNAAEDSTSAFLRTKVKFE